MSKLDSLGVFIFEVVESGLNVTKKGYPQWVARLKAMKKFIETPEDIAHFKGQGVITTDESQWVDWSTFNEDIEAFLVLFNSKESFDDTTKLLNYEQLQLALQWDGASFDALGDASMIGKQLLGRVEHNSYTNPETGKTKEGPQVSWIDSPDAPPQRQLKTIDTDGIKALSAKLNVSKKTPAAKPAKPTAAPTAAKPAATVAPTAAATVGTTPAPAASTSPKPRATKKAAATPVSSPAATPSSPPLPVSKAVTTPPVPTTKTEEDAAVTELPKETTKEAAWEFVCTHKGGNSDDVVTDAWIAACQEVGETKDEDAFTGTDWAKVRDIVVRDLKLDTK